MRLAETANDNELRIDITAETSEAQKALQQFKSKLSSAVDIKKFNRTLKATPLAVQKAFEIKPIETFTTSLKTATDTVSKFSKGFGAMAAGIAALGGLRTAVDGVIKKGDDLVTLADRLRITVKEAKGLQLNLQMGSGMDVEPFSRAMSRLRNTLNSNTSAAKEMKAMLDSLGIAYTDAEGHILSYDRLMDNLSKGYERVKESGYDTEYMMALFGARAEGMTETMQKWQGAIEKASQVHGTFDLGIDPQRLMLLQQEIDILEAQSSKFKDMLGQLFVPFVEQGVPAALTALQSMADLIRLYKDEIRVAAEYMGKFALVWAAQNTVTKVAAGLMGVYRALVIDATNAIAQEGTQAKITSGTIVSGNQAAASSFNTTTAEIVMGNHEAALSFTQTEGAIIRMTASMGTVVSATGELAAAFSSALSASSSMTTAASQALINLEAAINAPRTSLVALMGIVDEVNLVIGNTVANLSELSGSLIISLDAVATAWGRMAETAKASSGSIAATNKAVLAGLEQLGISLSVLHAEEQKAVKEYIASMSQASTAAMQAAAKTVDYGNSMALTVEACGRKLNDLNPIIAGVKRSFIGASESAETYGTVAKNSINALSVSITGATANATALSEAMSTLAVATENATIGFQAETVTADQMTIALREAGIAGTQQGEATSSGAATATAALERETAAAIELASAEVKAEAAAVQGQAQAAAAHNEATASVVRQTTANEQLTAAETAAGAAGVRAGNLQAGAAAMATGAVNILSGAVRMLASNWLLVAWAAYEALDAFHAYEDAKLEATLKEATGTDVDVGRAGGILGVGSDSYYIDPMNGSLRRNKIVIDEAPDGTPIGQHNEGVIVTDPKEVDAGLKAVSERGKAKGKYNIPKPPAVNLPEVDPGIFGGGADTSGGGSSGGSGGSSSDAAKKTEEALKSVKDAITDLQNKILEFNATDYEKAIKSISDETVKVKDTIAKAQAEGIDTAELENTLSEWITKAKDNAEKALKNAQEVLGYDTAAMIAETADSAFKKAEAAYNKAWAALDSQVEAKKKEVMRNSEDISALNMVYEWEAAQKEKIAKDYQKSRISAAIESFNNEIALINAETEAYNKAAIVRDALNRSTYEKEIDYITSVLEKENLTIQQRIELLKKLAEAKKHVRDIPLNDQEAIKNGLEEALESFGTYYGNLQDVSKTCALSMRDAFQDSFFDAMQGKLKSLGDYICDFLNEVQKAIARAMANMFATKIINAIIPGLGGIGANAAGGYQPLGSSFVVGENGPELVSLTGSGAHITSTNTTQRRMAAGNNNCNVVVNVVNKSGNPVNAEQGPISFDGEKYIVGVVLNAYSKNTMGMRDLIKNR